ncbi:MAG: DUF2332 domain-containing protein [Halopenitus sp.]
MADLATAFERYAGWAADVTPLYETLASAAAADERLLDIAAAAPEGQPAPQLLLAAVHSLLLEGESHPLTLFYPTCRGDEVTFVDGDTPSADGDTATADGDPAAGNPVPHFREFCLANEAKLRERIASRRVQTNDVGRSAVLLPAFTHVHRRTDPDSLALIELGASAGLNLNWDRYGYRYGRNNTGDDDAVRRAGDPDSPVTIETDVRGAERVLLPPSLPPVPWRVGVDENPLDPTETANARWLHALVHPDQPGRHRRLDAALAVARRHQPTVVEGDAVTELPRLLGAAPPDAALVVFSTHFLYQLPSEAVDRLREILAAHSRYRPVDWLSIDPDADLGTPVYRRVAFRDGDAAERQLAQFESYGDWLRWFE